MVSSTHIAVSVALVLSAGAAISDWRTGTIPNWLTLPPLVFAPVGYGFASSPTGAAQSMAAALLSGTVPYLLFRQRAMGGGDVKLFAALGAITGFDPLLGLRIELGAFIAAMAGAICFLSWDRRLFAVLRRAFGRRKRISSEPPTPVKLGGPVLVATVAHCAQHLPWVRP